MFSSIEENKRSEVVEKCYWPLLRLAESGVKLSIEMTGLTLELVNELDSSWVTTFRSLLSKNQIELIGSGYSQIIAPLVPYEVNRANLRVGKDVYFQLLHYEPTVYLVNEMAFSKDLISLYQEEGIKNIIIEWNNFYKYSRGVKKEHSFKPLNITNGDSSSLNLIWADSVLFQKFQRLVHKELESEEFLLYLEKREQENSEQYLPLYTSDVEIFDFRPGRYKTENNLGNDEWKTIEELYKQIGLNHTFVFLSEIVSQCEENIPTMSFDPVFPIQVKKQEKYNIYRWAIGGRNNLELNADCYKIFKSRFYNQKCDNQDWKNLLFYWSSDFRTHITIPRFLSLKEKISEDLNEVVLIEEDNSRIDSQPNGIEIEMNKGTIRIETNAYVILFNRKKGLVIESFIPKGNGRLPVIGQIQHGTYDDITFSNDYLSGYAICYDNERKQHTHLFNRNETIEKYNDRIVIKATNDCNGKFRLKDEFSAYTDRVELKREITILDDNIDIIHPFVFTFLPESYLRTLTYRVNCGGNFAHKHALNNWTFTNQQSKYLTISAINGISPTEGILSILDSNDTAHIYFKIDNTLAPLVFNFQYEDEVGIGDEKLPFCWLVISAQEINDAYKGNSERSKVISASISIF